MIELYLKYKIFRFLKYLRKLNINEHQGVSNKNAKHFIFCNDNNIIEYRYVLIKPYNFNSIAYEFIVNKYKIIIYDDMSREFKSENNKFLKTYDIRQLTFKDIKQIFLYLKSNLDKNLKRTLKLKKILK